MKILLQNGASMKGYAPIVTKLLTIGAKVDIKDNARDTSLHVATSKSKMLKRVEHESAPGMNMSFG